MRDVLGVHILLVEMCCLLILPLKTKGESIRCFAVSDAFCRVSLLI